MLGSYEGITQAQCNGFLDIAKNMLIDVESGHLKDLNDVDIRIFAFCLKIFNMFSKETPDLSEYCTGYRSRVLINLAACLLDPSETYTEPDHMYCHL